MNPNSQNNDPSSDVASTVEEADKEVARSAARHRHHPVVKTLGTASEIADQIPLSIVWSFSDVANGLMAVPNLIGLLILSGLVVRETREYLAWDPYLKKTPEEVAEFVERQQMDWR